MKTVEFTRFACPVRDEAAEEYARTLFSEAELLTSNELVIHWVRVFIKEKLLDHKDVLFVYGDHKFHADHNGRIESWPPGFCDHYDKVLCRLI